MVRWLAFALQQGTAITVTDGSYNRNLAPDVSDARWLITRTARHKLLGGWFYEQPNKASSYWVELLGAVATHLLAAFDAEYFSVNLVRPQKKTITGVHQFETLRFIANLVDH